MEKKPKIIKVVQKELMERGIRLRAKTWGRDRSRRQERRDVKRNLRKDY